MAKQKTLFLINPISGVKKPIDWQQMILENIDDGRFDFEIRYTRAKGDATQMAKQAASDGVDIVCAVGGDGTINEVAKGLMGTKTALAIVPRGSGNGLARHFSIPTEPAKAVKNLNRAKLHNMDVGILNEELFLCVAGIGFDATVAQAFDDFGKRGLLSYTWLALSKFINYKPLTYDIKVAGRQLKTRAFLIAFANASQFGNNAYIAPQANTNDGLLNLVIIKPFPLWQAFDIAFKTFKGTIHKSRYHDALTFNQLTITSSNGLVHLDGEPSSVDKEIRVSIHPQPLKIVY